MAQHLLRAPALAVAGYEAGLEMAGGPPHPPLSHFLVTGIGGSAIGGDLVRDLVVSRCSVPVIPHRGFGVPAFVGPASGVVAVSYSGETAETLSGFEEALSRGARLWAVTSGGTLAERSQKAGVPLALLPGDLPPRAALAALFFSLLGLGEGLGLFGPQSEAIKESIEVCENLNNRCRPEAEEKSNPALVLALKLMNGVPTVYGVDGLTDGAARRWKCQFNENSKMVAYGDALPELAHNEIASFEKGPASPTPPTPPRMVVLLEDPEDSPRVARQRDQLAQWLKGRGVAVERVSGEGTSRLARLVSLVIMGDWVSYYAAVLRGVDPTPIESIDSLKNPKGKEKADP